MLRAEEIDTRLTFGASVSYVYDLEEPVGFTNNSLLYANLEEDEAFNIDLVQLGLEARRGKATFGAKVDFGDLALFAGDSDDGDVGLQEAFLTYELGRFIVRAGRFDTAIGYEMFEPWANNQISRSRAWHFQPINHDGVTLSTAAGPVGIMVGAMNGFFVADNIANDVNSDKGALVSLSSSPRWADLSVTALYSEEDIFGFEADHFLVNALASKQIERSSFALEGNWLEEDPELGASAGTWNVTAYAGTDIGRSRWDLRADFGNYDTLTPAFFDEPPRVHSFDIWSVTATFGWILSRRLDVRIEYRHEQTDDSRLFAEDDDPFAKSTADVLQVQAVWYPEDD